MRSLRFSLRVIASVSQIERQTPGMDEERKCCFAECWTGLNRSRRWLQGEATREQTHELIAKTLEHILRTFGAPLAPQKRRLTR